MTEENNKPRPVRKLTVDNFSVIKHAELEFGKFTVLIGPQASGKSLLCKLAYFLEKQVVDMALAAILEKQHYEYFKTVLIRALTERFPTDTWKSDCTDLQFNSQAYSVQIRVDSLPSETGFEVDFSEPFKKLFSTLASLVAETNVSGADSRRFLYEQVGAQLRLLINGDYIDDSVYIPAGRAFFLNQSMGLSALANLNVDPIVRDFSLEVRLGQPWSPNPVSGEHVLRALDEIRREMVRIAGGHLEGWENSIRFRRFSDGRTVPLTFLSSGTQELLPLFNVLGQMATRQRDRVIFPRKDNLPGMPNEILVSKGRIYLEEPESNNFPSAQNDLVRLFARLSGEPRLDFSWVITTHSPYILTAFNNLIEAGQVAAAKPDLKSEVAKLIPERYWIGPGDFKAYAIEDGVLKSIVAEDTGLVSANYLDQVSETIGAEFDELLRLGYVES